MSKEYILTFRPDKTFTVTSINAGDERIEVDPPVECKLGVEYAAHVCVSASGKSMARIAPADELPALVAMRAQGRQAGGQSSPFEISGGIWPAATSGDGDFRMLVTQGGALAGSTRESALTDDQIKEAIAIMYTKALPIGHLHSYWDVISDANAILEGRSSILSREQLCQMILDDGIL